MPNMNFDNLPDCLTVFRREDKEKVTLVRGIYKDTYTATYENGAVSGYTEEQIGLMLKNGQWILEDAIKPSHYHQNGIDVIQFAKMQFPKEEVKGFMRINILKYATRYDRKGGVEDLKKLAKYTDLLIELEEEEQ